MRAFKSATTTKSKHRNQYVNSNSKLQSLKELNCILPKLLHNYVRSTISFYYKFSIISLLINKGNQLIQTTLIIIFLYVLVVTQILYKAIKQIPFSSLYYSRYFHSFRVLKQCITSISSLTSWVSYLHRPLHL